MKKIRNYHTHTLFCGHGKGYPIDYAKIALENNFEVLGFSEHAPIDIKAFYFTIAGYEDDYFNEVTKIKNLYPNLTILCGLEVDYFEDFHSYYEKLLNKLLPVYNKPEGHTELVRRLTAKHHTTEEYLKVIYK